MKKKIVTWVLLFGFCFAWIVVKADIFDDIASALRKGESHNVSKFFDTVVELKIVDKSSNYSRNQAEHVLKEFLDQHTPKSFNIVHRGSSAKGSQYSIGNLETNKGTFRTYMYMKDVNGKLYIQELSFEKQ